MRQFLDIEENRVWTLEDLKSLFDYKIKHDELNDQCDFEEWLEDNLVENKGFLVEVVWLQMSEWNECNNNIITDFLVRKDWLQSKISKPLGSHLAEEGTFLGDYTSDDIYPLYDLATCENAVIKEQVYK